MQAPFMTTNETGLLIKDIADRTKVKGTYLVWRKQAATDKNGKSYINMVLGDRTGQIDARVFENAEQLAVLFEEQDHVRISGTAKLFQGRLQLHVNKVERAPREEIVAADFMPVSGRDPAAMWQEFLAAIDTLTDPD